MLTSKPTKNHSGTEEVGSREAQLAVYNEICQSYHAIDDFRTKLLGILPISSLAGILILGKDSLLATANADATAKLSSQALIGFGSFFAAAFTVALFVFEIRGILRCHELIERGKDLEKVLAVRGQFWVCSKQHDQAAKDKTEGIFNAKVAASLVYSLVFSAWLFIALKFSFDLHVKWCGVTAIAVGTMLGVGAYKLINKKIAP